VGHWVKSIRWDDDHSIKVRWCGRLLSACSDALILQQPPQGENCIRIRQFEQVYVTSDQVVL